MFKLFRKKNKKTENKDFMREQMDIVVELLKKGEIDDAKIHATAMITAIIQDYFDAYGTRWSKFESEFDEKFDKYNEKAKELLKKDRNELTRDEIYDISKFYYIGDDYKAKTKLSTYYFCDALITLSDALTDMFKFAGAEFTPDQWMDIIYPGNDWRISEDKHISDYPELIKRNIKCNPRIVDIVSHYQENPELLSLSDSTYEKITYKNLTIKTGNPHMPTLIHPETVDLIIENLDKVRKGADLDTFSCPDKEVDIYDRSGFLEFFAKAVFNNEYEKLRGMFRFTDFFTYDSKRYLVRSHVMTKSICAIDKIYKERFGNGHSAGYEASRYKICTDMLNEILGFEHKDPFAGDDPRTV